MSLPGTMKAAVTEGDSVVVKSGVPVPPVGDEGILVKVQAVAGNPTDWKHATYKIGPQGSIVGCDVAGKVVKVGRNVKNFKVGDEIYSVVHGSSVKHPENGAFADYSVLDSNISLKVPSGATLGGKEFIPAGPVRSIEAAASLPVSLFTAGQILTYNMGLKREWEPAKPQHDYPLLVWGGATAVGQLTIQLAKKMNGFTKIIAVASKKHEKTLKSYGVDELFDYHDSDVIEQIKKTYDYLPQLLDAVSAPESFTQVYKLGSKDAPTTLLQLTTMNEEIIKPEERNPNVKVEGTMLYSVTGLEVPFGNMTIPANPQYRQTAIDFIQFIEPKINNGEIYHIPLQTFKGLDAVPDMLNDIKQGKNSNVKYVALF
ncbi:hypothetical protein HG535_0G00800 [Zygotorulaspora mrakii]|uniref:Enoyl reductase (ER) domain-containing protein n=1 Tax=Zygotorulaspora mrakii TaxID=42260 RepID=A0A7H9B769_ZYGMR|nr:uncharacterized protein HG535_0G00800 [Zygotorulaspora mrakii]QLG74196.1 hypothetical protein HG535_0G00800 [Zygotorulaspora mrakii]